jgi:ribonuclease HII
MSGEARTKRRRRPAAVFGLLRRERDYRDRGIRLLAGVDEAGVGPLAGPLVAAAVIMPPESRIRGVNDSKQVLQQEKRQELAARILSEAVSVGVGVAFPREIDRVNIYQAGLRAMARALRRLRVVPELVLVDARRVPGIAWPQEAHVRGDGRFYQIACASLVAKTYRDRLMQRLDERYPGYGFAHNFGYPTLEHRDALARLGPCWIHRRDFHGVREDPQLELELVLGGSPPELTG